MNRDIKTKPVSRTPKEMDKGTRLPKELIRRGMDETKEKLSGQASESVARDGMPETYAAEQVEHGMDTITRKTGDAAADAAGKVKKQINRRIKIREKEADAPSESHAESDTPKGSAHPKSASQEQARRQSTESGKRRVQQMARERRSLRNTRGTESESKPLVMQSGAKTASKGTVKTTKKSIKSAEKTVKAAGKSVKTTKKATKTAAKTAKQTVKSTERAVKAAKVAAKATAQAAKVTVKAVATAVKLAIAAAKGLLAAITAGGWVVLVVLLIIVAVAAIFASPAGILVGGGGDDTPTVAEAVRTVNEEMYERVEQIQARHSDAKEIHISYFSDTGGQYAEHWVDILGVFAVKCNLDPDNPRDVIVMDEARMSLLRQVFWDMVSVTYSVEEREVQPASSTSPEPSPAPTPGMEKILYIDINAKSYTEMPTFYHFADEQTEALNALMEPDMRKMLLELLTLGDADLMLTPEEVAAIEANLPPDLSPSRRMVVLTAHSLVGKVNYFWGGKSEVIGWDTRWGTPRVVTSGNSPTTGTTRPFGLDCSGFVTWTFINAAQDKEVVRIIGHGTVNQFPKSTAITWNEALPGDLAFFSPPGGNNHVGIIVGRNPDGSLLICHCSSSKNNVVVSVAQQGKTSFKYIRRPDAYYAIYP
ncbi:C40 family peptidase [Christensenella minuta]|uniref:C40 family peptidase n=1 Tax=Christensenella minuta TaxID=626937 RepID=UPI0021579368|nr:C40 family peptidase [Christensenella minuta]